MTFRQRMDDSKPLVLAKTASSTEELKFYLDAMDACPEVFQLLSITPDKEV